MIILLVAGIACLALCGLQLSRSRTAVDRDRRAALETVRSSTHGGVETSVSGGGASALFARAQSLLARVHERVWRKESARDIDTKLRRAGVSSRLTAEAFMAGRVALTALCAFAGFTMTDGGRRVLLALALGAAASYLPAFFVSKAAARRTERIDAELSNFVDQLAVAIEAGMTFDAALNHLLEASHGPLAEEMRRVLTELRVGETRPAALRSFAERVGSESVTGFTNAVIASDQLGSSLAGILHAQAADLRHRRQMKAEERAQKAPVKMLVPMAIFILPVMFVVILAPAFLAPHSIF
jgi:tight adherence protein C